MAIRIDGKPTRQPVTSAASRGDRRVEGAPAGAADGRGTRAGEGAGDAVHLGAVERAVETVRRQTATLPEVDVERVEALKARLARGDWRPDPAAVADGLLGEALALREST